MERALMEKKKNNPIAKELRTPKYKSQVIPNKKKTYFEDFHDKMVEEKELLNISMKEAIRQKKERKMKEPYTIIHTKEFSCEDDHPLVYYVVNEKGEGMCDYCAKRFKYEEKKEERTPSEKLQDELEPI